MRPFRFGVQLRTDDPSSLRRQAEAAEAAGFDVVCTYDHLDTNSSALLPLAAIATWTTTIRLCPLVLNNDFHHPAMLAQELATLDRLSGGRIEAGVGAGHAFTEYQAAGIAFDPPRVRKERLAESVGVLRRLLDGETVTFAGDHYTIDGLQTLPPVQEHVPLLVGVNGRRALAHAAQHADIIGLTMLGRTLADGHQHEVRWAPDILDATVAHIRDAAGERLADLELNALVQVVQVTDDREHAAEVFAADIPGLSPSELLTTPFVAFGTPDEIADHLTACRDRWGISYFVVREVESFAPVMERLRSDDARR